MSAKATFWAWEQKLEHAPTKLVLLCLADREGKEGGCWPSIRKISEDTSLSETTVHNAISNLVVRGYITKSSRKTEDGDADSNFYRLNITELTCKQVENSQGGGTPDAPGVVRGADQGGAPRVPGVVRHTHPNLKEEPESEPTSRTSLALCSAKEVNKDGSGWSDNGQETSSHNCDSSAPKGARISAPVPEPPIPENVLPQSELFDALVELEGAAKPFTRSFAGKIRSAQKDILSAFPDFKASELPIFVKAYRKKFPGMQVTAKAIAKWMPTLNGVSSAKTFRSEDM